MCFTAIVPVTPWHWAIFILFILLFLALDLGVFHRRAHVVKLKEALGWTTLWVSLALLFFFSLRKMRGSEEAFEFLTGYFIELSLSMDNVFVIALIFSYFRVPAEFQHRVLFWGILGALVMRGVMIALGAALIARFDWILYIFGAFLVFSGTKMMFTREEGVHPERNPLIRWARKLFPVTPRFHGQHFFTVENGKKTLTPLALVLLMVETTDLVFALDSIPAIFAVTKKAFIVFTSNVFAILGLRSLYFLLAGIMEYFRYLKYGLSIVLVFVGVKMLLMFFEIHIHVKTSLMIVGAIIFTSMAASVIAAKVRPRKSQDSKGE